MRPCSVYLFDPGFPELPGFSSGVPAASFPFWGNYTFLDFALANLAHLSAGGYHLIAEGRFRALLGVVTARAEAESARLHLLEGSLAPLLDLLEQDGAETVVLSSLATLCLLDREALRGVVAGAGASIVKISLSSVPVDLYVGGRKRLIRSLRERLERPLAEGAPARLLFEEVLHSSFESLEEIPGTILFQGSLMQLFRQNLRLAEEAGTPELAGLLAALREVPVSARETVVSQEGRVKDSFLSAGARIEGTVEGSVIFADVVVRRGAVVTGSVIMSGNRIGTDAQVSGTLALPYAADSAKGTSNIGEGAAIGLRRSVAMNQRFPRQIRDGLTVLGMNCEIPGGYRIGPACLVGAEVPFQRLRDLKEMRKGQAVLWTTDR